MREVLERYSTMPEIQRPKYICIICSKTRARFECGRCHSVDYCSKECQKKDWKRHKKLCAPVVFKEIDHRGRGLVATKDIKMGDHIFDEELLFGMAVGHRTLDKTYVEGSILSQILDHHPSSEGEKEALTFWMHLVRDYPKLRILDTFIDDSNEILFDIKFFPSIFRFGHKCSPNAAINKVPWRRINGDGDLREIRAIKDIKKGEEVTINYLFTFPQCKVRYYYLRKEARKEELVKWDVECDCNCCVLDEEEEIIQELIDIDCKKGISFISSSSPYRKVANLQYDLVTKLQNSYLAPFLLPLECARLVAYSYFANDQNLMTTGFAIWENMMESTKNDFYQEQFAKFQDLPMYRKDLCNKVMELLDEIDHGVEFREASLM